jgi:ABC-type uncharacterized transport system substrate-binding protein
MVAPHRPLMGCGTRMIRLFGIALAALALFTAAAQAHPHVWVTMKSEVVYGADGVATGIRHAWTFDDMFSTYATQGLESKEKGKFTREELAALAQVNIESLKEFDYFTLANLNGKKTQLKPPVDYYLEFADGLLTLNFTLPLAAPGKAQSLDFEMFDPTWFVDFSFADKEPARLTGAPEGCKLTVLKPGEEGSAAKPKSQPGEAFFNNLNPSSSYGAKFANKIQVACP